VRAAMPKRSPWAVLVARREAAGLGAAAGREAQCEARGSAHPQNNLYKCGATVTRDGANRPQFLGACVSARTREAPKRYELSSCLSGSESTSPYAPAVRSGQAPAVSVNSLNFIPELGVSHASAARLG
jgi:hypothetical protein